jgi:DNA-binding winged helix-turn-helix (wHTH) protein
MEVSDHRPRVARFGVFEADLRTGELRRKGQRVKLQNQPFQVLAMLVERPGELVTREELRKTLWPSDLFVDFEHSLNTAINKIRRVLGDLAGSARYVETLPRRGYRFLAPVEWVDRASAITLAAGASGGVCRVVLEGHSVPLHEGANLIGRDPDSEVAIDSSTVSRRHARITVDDGQATIEDLGSKNGTSVRGRRLDAPKSLVDGDEILVGAITLLFRSASPPGPTKTVPHR